MDYWTKRGGQDALKGNTPLFRRTRRYGIIAEFGEFDTREEEIEVGTSYLEGYNEIVRRGHEGVAEDWY